MKFDEFEKRIKTSNLQTFSIGKSALGQEILACHIGKSEGKQVLIQAGIHAREYITSLLALVQAERLQGTDLPFGVYFVFCSNPDGVSVVLDGFSTLKEKERVFCVERGFEHKLFKANANLVDLNTNFDALWGQGASNIKTPNFENYIGESPESEVETRNLVHFTKEIRPALTLSYHTKGEVVYYGFDTQSEESLRRDEILGRKISDALGFPLLRSFSSCGGYKDWAVDKLDIPSFTIEFGKNSLSHPIGEEHLGEIEKNSKNLFEALEFCLEELDKL